MCMCIFVCVCEPSAKTKIADHRTWLRDVGFGDWTQSLYGQPFMN